MNREAHRWLPMNPRWIFHTFVLSGKWQAFPTPPSAEEGNCACPATRASSAWSNCVFMFVRHSSYIVAHEFGGVPGYWVLAAHRLASLDFGASSLLQWWHICSCVPHLRGENKIERASIINWRWVCIFLSPARSWVSLRALAVVVLWWKLRGLSIGAFWREVEKKANFECVECNRRSVLWTEHSVLPVVLVRSRPLTPLCCFDCHPICFPLAIVVWQYLCSFWFLVGDAYLVIGLHVRE